MGLRVQGKLEMVMVIPPACAKYVPLLLCPGIILQASQVCSGFGGLRRKALSDLQVCLSQKYPAL